MKFLKVLSLLVILAVGGSGVFFKNTSAAVKANEREADNTQINERDRSSHELTADLQSNDKSDVAITRMIRQNLIKDKNLSTYAHNVKVITAKGKVTLKGPVRSEQEKAMIAHKAQLVAGAENVRNQLEVSHKN